MARVTVSWASDDARDDERITALVEFANDLLSDQRPTVLVGFERSPEYRARIVRRWRQQQTERQVPERDKEWALLFTACEWTTGQIAEAFNVSRQRVHQVLTKQQINIVGQARERRLAADAQRQLERVLDAMAHARPCPMCGGWAIRPGAVTCSPRCAVLNMSAARSALDPERYDRHRLTNARSILRHPDRHASTRIDWARRMLSDDPPPPNRRFRRDSLASALITEAGISDPRPLGHTPCRVPCAATNNNGTACKRYVANPGDVCHIHARRKS